MIFGDGTKTIRMGTVHEGIALFGARITTLQAVLIVSALLLFLAAGVILRHTKAGMQMRALASSSELARAVGVDTNRVILLVFIAGSGLAGAAGILMGYDTDLTPLMGFRALLMAIAAVIVGGVGSPMGAIIGGFGIGLISQLAALWLPVHWQEVIVFAVLILFLLIRPRGVFGKPLRARTV
jgi:branched-chain amino acid transport system permease protein